MYNADADAVVGAADGAGGGRADAGAATAARCCYLRYMLQSDAAAGADVELDGTGGGGECAM